MQIENLKKSIESEKLKIIRKDHLAEKIVIVDGQPGCGKSMLSVIVASLERTELLTYAYELEYVCALHYLGKIETDAAIVMVRMLTDLQLYNTMMSREVNFRPSDVSSVFRSVSPLRYIRRLFQVGDSAVPSRVKQERPILSLNTHNLCGISEPILSALGERLVFIELLRHPLYMMKQQALNMEYLIGNVRDFTIYFDYNNQQLPFFAKGWEDLFVKSNYFERAIYAIEKLIEKSEKVKELMIEKYNTQILTIPFECFVTDPLPHMRKIEELLGTKITKATKRMMKRQNVPRKMYAQGIGLKIYKRCGWEPPMPGSDENKEFALRRKFVKEKVSLEAMNVLDCLCTEYENKYLGGKKDYD